MTRQEAIALARELRRYSARLDDLCEQASEALENPGTDEVMAWQGGVVESALAIARHAIGHAIGAIEAAHHLDDDAEEPKELGN